MRNRIMFVVAITLLAATSTIGLLARGDDNDGNNGHGNSNKENIQVGPRPFYLVNGMDPSPLKDKLLSCQDGPFHRTDFSIAHRGAALQFPEHTKESYEAGARMGAGIVECDVTYTKGGELVCRHSECDLATTTNIVSIPDLNVKCTTPWTPGSTNAKCCTSDLTLADFKDPRLRGKMDASVPGATTPAAFMGGTASWRTDVNTGRGTLMTLSESIALNEKLGVKHTPELKSPDGNPPNFARINSIFGSQANYEQKILDELKAANVNPKDVWLQSFDLKDVLYWIEKEPQFGKQAVYLDDIDPTVSPAIPPLTPAELQFAKDKGVKIIAPPMWALLSVNAQGEVIPSAYAQLIKSFGFDIITWTFERADLRNGAKAAGFYYLFDQDNKAIKKDSDMYKALDALARKVGVLGIFSDWAGTVTYYSSCMGLK